MAQDTDFAQGRKELASDRYRPAYHFVAPYGWMNDPNGTVYWRGRWHLFYQYAPNRFRTGDGTAQWGHAVSEDLLHWQDMPIALVPTPGTYDEKGCWSGTAMVEDDCVIANYHAHMGGNCIATCSDEWLTDWAKHPANPVIPFRAEKTYDPCLWKQGNLYYSISGRITQWEQGNALDQTSGGKDIAYLFKSADLTSWEDAGALYEGGIFTNPGEDCACPDFFALGDKHMLLFLSHNQGAQYYIGDYSGERFTPRIHGRMNFTKPSISRLGICGDLAAPISWKGPNGRRIVIAWIPEGRSDKAMQAAGWAGIQCLPREIFLGPEGQLKIEPVKELEALRRDRISLEEIALTDGTPLTLESALENMYEMRAIIEPGTADQIGVRLCRSGNGEEETVVTIDLRAGTLSLDPSRASMDHEVTGLDAQVAPLKLKPGEPLELRIFVDRSVVEVFADHRQCVTKRIYPSQPDSQGIQIVSSGGDSRLRALDIWKMDSVWPLG